MIDKYNLDLKIMKQIVKESVSIYNELRPHYSNMLTNKMHLQSQIKMRTYKIKKHLQKILQVFN
jgi:succinyl-CoA synthetase beta subunit